jgi:hypothetical protein
VLINLLCVRHDAGRDTLITSMTLREDASAKFPAHWVDRVGEYWLAISSSGSMRRAAAAPQLGALARARRVARLELELEYMASRVSAVDERLILEMGRMLDASRADVEARAKRVRGELLDVLTRGERLLDTLMIAAVAEGES